MQLRVAIVDDLRADAAQLEKDLAGLMPEDVQMSCDGFFSGEAFVERFVRGAYDLVFMDIRMEGMNGIEASRQIREIDPRCLIVFLTTSADFAWEAFPVHPFDYLLKPYELARLEGVLTGALRLLDAKEPEIELRIARRSLRVPFDQIYYAVAQNHFVVIVTSEGEYRSHSTFGELQRTLLQDARFLLCNRGVIINMEAVLQFHDDCITMVDNAQFSVRQRSKTELFNAFTQFQFRHMKRR